MSARTLTTIFLIFAAFLLLGAVAVFIAQNVHLFATPIMSPVAPQPVHQPHW